LDVAQVSARRYLRLGDLLWDQDRALAASTEYEKASHEAPDDPIIGARLARAALSAGKPERALLAVERLATRYPDHAPSQAMLGAARLALHNRAGAALALRQALYINPFDPQPHCDLAQASDDRDEQARELAACRTLRQSP
jgi:predicted Zn-dependent protease